MTVLRRPLHPILLLASLLLLSCSGAADLAPRLGIDALPSGVEVDRYRQGSLGPDPYQLWQLAPMGREAFEELVQVGGVKAPDKRAMSGCLGLNQYDAPDWWPAVELEDASWDYTSTPYTIYVSHTPSRGTLCIYRHESTMVAYVQWFRA